MPHVVLETEQGWRGEVYPAGPAFIPDDLAIALGLTPSPSSDQPEADRDEGLEDAIARLAELEAIFDSKGKRDWQAIKAIGDELGVEKHPDGWDASFLRIIEAEFSPEIAKALEVEE